ncbi:MAG: MotA/TolQ/ExbB proton channel family protein [Akkermansia sp.]|nr:MotA/TolQ/ExbB proton channel family protein [Akkermansia sp.]MBQ9096228.1 MotA/TolQ/ExbB proton channel family protein [Akkermansia sp.]
MYNTIQQFFDACHPFGYPLLTCSVLLVTAIFFQWYIRLKSNAGADIPLWWARLTVENAEQREHNIALIRELAHKQPLVRIILFIAEHKDMPTLPTLVESRLRQYIDRSRAGMTLISTITNIAPMIGILGTAWGLVDIFGVFGTPGAQEGIALGISKALYTTIFGLAIAVPGIIAQSCFERALEREAAQLDEQFTYLLAMCHKS